MKPGYVPDRRNYDGRCLQLSTASVLGIPWEDAPRGWDGEESDQRWGDITHKMFWGRWRRELREAGYEAVKFYPNGENEPEGFWIAITNGSSNSTHAVVMKGKKLHYDPSLNRVHRPHKFHEAFKLVPLDGDN